MVERYCKEQSISSRPAESKKSSRSGGALVVNGLLYLEQRVY